MNKILNGTIDALLPALVGFGPIFIMIGCNNVGQSGGQYRHQFLSLVAGAMMLSFGGSALVVRIARLEREIKELKERK